MSDVTEEQDREEEHEREMTLLEHLQELRQRLTWGVVALIVGLFACYPFADQLFNYLILPIRPSLPPESAFIYTAPTEGFVTYLKVALVAAVFGVSPFLFYQIWAFVAPGLYPHERRWVLPIALISTLFFLCGAAFGYFIVFPVAYEFLFGFATDIIRPMPALNEVLSFSLHMLFAFGVIFETPLFIFFLGVLGLVTPKGLRKQRKFAILAAFIVAAILTPTPDAFNQTLMAGPLIILYEVGIIAIAIFVRQKKAPATDEFAGEPPAVRDDASPASTDEDKPAE